MPKPGDVIEGHGGFRLKIIRNDPEVLEMEATYPGDAGMPPVHWHPSQTERFEVLEGEVTAIVDGESIYKQGDSFEVPPGVGHQMAANGPTRTNWQTRPALRTADFFAALGSGSANEDTLKEYAPEFRLA